MKVIGANFAKKVEINNTGKNIVNAELPAFICIT